MCRGGHISRIGECPTVVRAQDTRGAHLEHPKHGRDHGRVEAQRLIERPRILSSHKEGIHDVGREVRAGRQAGKMGRRPKRHMRTGRT